LIHGKWDPYLPAFGEPALPIMESGAFKQIIRAIFDCAVEHLPGVWKGFITQEVYF